MIALLLSITKSVLSSKASTNSFKEKYAISSIELSEIKFEAANRNEKKRKVVKVIIDRFII